MKYIPLLPVDDSGFALKPLLLLLIGVFAVAVAIVARPDRLLLQQVASLSHAESNADGQEPRIFSYRDAEGKLHFVDDLEKVPEAQRNAARKRDDLPALNRVPAAPERPAGMIQRARVRILVADWCGYCRKLEQFLKKSGIRYEKFDVENNASGRALYTRYGAGGIPITLVNDEVIRGFNPDAIMNAVKEKSNGTSAS